MARERISRTEAEIREAYLAAGGLITVGKDGEEFAWETCGNCGGSGNYPSSMSPPGRCRLYCWRNRTPRTYGKHPVRWTSYVRRQQNADRREHHAARAAEETARTRAERIASPDARIAALATAFSLNLADLPPHDEDRNYRFAADLCRGWLLRGDLSEKQWAWVAKLPALKAEKDRERAEREARNAASEWFSEPGNRIEVPARVVRVSTYVKPRYSYYDTSSGLRMEFVDPDGHVFVWFTTENREEDRAWAEGDEVWLKGTVKKLDEWKGAKQTVLTRCRVSPREEA